MLKQKKIILFLHCMGITGSHAMESLEHQLIDAVQFQKEEHIKALLVQKANPNHLIDGQNALHVAAKIGRTNVVKLLLNAEAEINAEAPKYLDATPLCLAVYNGYDDTVQLLIERNANLNDKLRQLEATPLHIAAMKERWNSSKLLLEAGADVHATMHNQSVPLHCVAECGALDFIDMMPLIEDSSSRKPKKKNSQPILCNPYVIIAQLLLKHGALVDQNAPKGTPLHLAARHCQPELVKLFIKHGADVSARRPMQITPLHEAVVGYVGQITKSPSNRSSARILIEAFLCTPSRKVMREARKSAVAAAICFLRMSKTNGSWNHDVRTLLSRYCLVPFLVDEQIKELRILFGLRMNFAGSDFTPQQLAKTRIMQPASQELAQLLDPEQVEQHRQLIYSVLMHQLGNLTRSSYTC